MLKYKHFVQPESLEEALKLNQVRTNCVLGGTGWLKMGGRNWNNAIDLGALGLDQVEETEDSWRIGAMVTLRQLEKHSELNAYTHGALRDCVKHIVGVQFRNCATIGGTIWGRYGFSDVLTCLMALDCSVELAAAGEIALPEFAEQKMDNDIITHVIVRKTPIAAAYDSFRNTETDFPVLTAAVARAEEGWRAAIGARPARAVRVTAETEEKLLQAVAGLNYGSNTRASGEYRAHLAQVLTQRCITQIKGRESK